MPNTGEQATARFRPPALAAMRDAIEEAGGNEVFFAGKLDSKRYVESVRVCSRGHDGAVTALFESLEAGEVVIHNHPTGVLTPSDADLELASVYSHNGHGVYIIDNAAKRVYVVIEPVREKDRHALDIAELERLLRPDSRFARTLPHFEVRPQQVRMMDMAARVFNENGIALIEAPTGVGKTVAYLLPAVLWAVRNRERVVISTRTINLQEQIMFKDVPALQRCLDEEFSAVLVKGRSNYLCLRRLNRAFSEASLFDDDDLERGLKALVQWSERTEDGSRADLPFVPGRDLWDKVCSEADSCVGSRCPSAQRCFLMKARQLIGKADIIVTNHHMFFSDVAVKRETGQFDKRAILPAYSRVIFDEAHSIEDSATEYFGIQAAYLGATTLLRRFIRRERGQERGLLPFIKIQLTRAAGKAPLKLVESALDIIDNDLNPALTSLRQALDAAFKALRSLTAEKCGQVGRDIKWRLTEEILADPELRELHKVYVSPAVEEITACQQHCNNLYDRLSAIVKELPDQPDKPLDIEMAQLRGYEARLHNLARVLSEGTSKTVQHNTVRWIEIDSHNSDIIRIIRCPLHVGPPLAEWVYENLKTVLMTSATLTVRKSFDYLSSRIGLDLLTGREIIRDILDSPFDHEKQAMLAIPTDMALPNADPFLEESVDAIRKVLHITQGHAFVLFTSFYALNFCHRALEAELRRKGITALRQGQSTRTRLLEQFRDDPASVLFATDSFWEGVDVAGDALQCVILPKLPFRVPTEPIQQARSEAIEREGGNAFMAYTVPQAVIKFRQGFGRLIRRRSDFGAVVVLDKRITTKQYGRVFLESLPGIRTVRQPKNETLEALRDFFATGSEQKRRA